MTVVNVLENAAERTPTVSWRDSEGKHLPQKSTTVGGGKRQCRKLGQGPMAFDNTSKRLVAAQLTGRAAPMA